MNCKVQKFESYAKFEPVSLSVYSNWETVFLGSYSHTYRKCWCVETKFGSNFARSGNNRLAISSDVPEPYLSSQSHKPFESESSHQNFFQVESQELSCHWFASSSQCRVT